MKSRWGIPTADSGGSRPPLLPGWLRRTVAYCLATLVLALTTWLVAHLLLAVPWVTFAVLVALLLAALLRPVAGVLAKAGAPDWLAALVSVLLLLGALLGSIYWVVRRVLHQFSDLQAAITSGVDDLRSLLTSPPISLDPQVVTDVRNRAVTYVQQAAPSPMTGATLVLTFLAAAVIVVFVLFFLLKDGPGMWRWALGWVPARRRDRTDGAARCAWATLTGYVRGTVVIAFADAVSIGAALFLLGVPLAASLTLLTFLGAFVPLVGATVSGALAVVVTLVTQGATDALIVLAVVLAVQQLEGNLLQPLVMGHLVQLHPVVILLAVTVGGLLAGIAGAVVAVPIVAVTYRVAQYLSAHSDRSARGGHGASTDVEHGDAANAEP